MGLFSRKKKAAATNTEQPKAGGEFNSNMIVPRIKANYGHEIYADNQHIPYLANSNKLPNGMEIPEDQQPYTITLFEDILLWFALDVGEMYEVLNNNTVQNNAALTDEFLLQVAVQNMIKSCGENIQMNGSPEEIVMVTAGGNFEAALILVDNFWEQMHNAFKGDVIISIPARDILFISPATSTTGIEKQKSAVKDFFNNPETQGLISKSLFRRTAQSGNFEFFDVAF